MKQCRLRLCLIFLVAVCTRLSLLAQADISHSPKLLLSPQRLRRLQRDRERQTERWLNFENRVNSVPDSPERGFELALYYAVTQDKDRGSQAVSWALAHPCEQRQVALVLDWAADQVSDIQRKQLQKAACNSAHGGAIASRDALFMQVAGDEDVDELVDRTSKPLLAELQSGNWQNGADLYAAFEYLHVVRSVERTDLRLSCPQFFLSLPAALLLSLKPEQISHPDWHIHIAALALVALDTNLTASQFLQGWALETQQTLREGEGVAYEFLWADPYLPGVGFQNLDPWSYDGEGNLFARSDWSPDACWIHVSKSAVEEQHCSPGWQQQPAVFGHLTLFPMTETCVQIPHRKIDETVVIWRLQPGQTVHYTLNNIPASVQADAAGMWKVPNNAESKVCTSLDTLKVPQAHKSARN